MSTKIVVVGGGFGGIKAARELAKDRRFEVTLISERPHFEYHAALYRSATGRSPLEVVVPLDAIFHKTNVRVIQDTITIIDVAKMRVNGSGGNIYDYEELVLALGSEVHFYNITGLAEHAYTLHDLASALRLKDRLHADFTNRKTSPRRYLVVGGGPSGVELAAELASYLGRVRRAHHLDVEYHIELAEAAPRILPALPERLSRAAERRLRRLGVQVYTSTAVKSNSNGELQLPAGTQKSHTVIWTAGAACPQILKGVFSLSNSRVKVRDDLSVGDHVYVVGDSADTAQSGWAQTALYDGGYAAAVIKAKHADEEIPTYKAPQPVAAIPVGPGWCVTFVNGIQLTGYFGWVVRRASDFDLYRQVMPLRLALRAWALGRRRSETCMQCQ